MDESSKYDDDMYCQVIAVRSRQPFKLSAIIESGDSEVLLLKNHCDTQFAAIEHNNNSWFKSTVKKVVDKKRIDALWDDNVPVKMATDEFHPQDVHLSRSSSASSFEAIMEGPLNSSSDHNSISVGYHPILATMGTSVPTMNHQMTSTPANSEPMATENNKPVDLKMNLTEVKKVDDEESMMEVILRNVMDMVNMAGVANDQASLDCLKRMVFRFAEEILAHDSLLELPYDSLIKTISMNRSDSIMEYALSKSILRWAESIDNRSVYLPSLLKHIKLGRLNPEQLINLGNQRLIRNSIECRDIIDEYKNSLLMSQSMNLQSLSISSNLSEAVSVSSTTAVASSGGETTVPVPCYLYILARGRSETTEEYSIHQIDMETGISLKIQSRPTFLCVNIEDNLYVIGHPNSFGRSVEMYNFEHQFWSTKNCWPMDLIISSVCVVGQYIYFLGFRDNGPYSLHQYDPVKDLVTPIRIAYEWVAIDGDIILAYEGLVLFVKTGLAYNPAKQCWKTLMPIPDKMVNGQSLIAFKDRLINFSAPDQFYWFNPKDGSEGCIAKWNKWLAEGGASYSLCPRVDLLVLNSKLYLVEKAIFENCTLQVIQYDDINDQWNKLHSISLIDKPIRCAICSSDS